jgi:two-component system, NarL family, invasion response regulator UvrY
VYFCCSLFRLIVATINIVIADNQNLTVAGLQFLLQDRTDFKIASIIHDPASLASEISRINPGVLIVDYNLPDYISPDQLEKVLSANPQNTLVITADDNKTSMMRVVQMGVHGFLTKSCSKEEIVMAIQATARGEKFFCHKVLNMVLEKSHPDIEETDCEPTGLTQRETEILKNLAAGFSTKKIADLLNLSPHTVHAHRKNIIKKLNIKSPTEFVVYALDFGLIKPKKF